MDKENKNVQNGPGVDKVDEWVEKIQNCKCQVEVASLLPQCIGQLLDDPEIDRNDKRVLTLFGRASGLLKGPKKLQFFQMAATKGFFQNTARFWMYWSLALDGDKKIEKLEEGLTKVSNPVEHKTLESYLQNQKVKLRPQINQPRKYTMKDVLYWSDIKKYCVGIVRPGPEGQPERVMYRYHDLYDRRNAEQFSLQEMKAKRWRKEAEESDLKARLAQLEMMHTSTNRTEEQNVSNVQKSPLKRDISTSGQSTTSSRMQIPLFSDEIDDTNESVDLCPPEPSVTKSERRKPEAVGTFTPQRVSPEQFASPKPTISILTPLKTDFSKKRDCSHLTPLAVRHPRTETQIEQKPKKTPTAVVNEVNDLVQNFFNSTKVFHKDQTQFYDDTPQRQTKTFLNVFDADSPDVEHHADSGKRRFSIFNDDDSASGIDSPFARTDGSKFVFDKKDESLNTLDCLDVNPSPKSRNLPTEPTCTMFDLSIVSGQTHNTENLKSDKTLHYSEFDGVEEVQSTRRITGGSGKSDAWITKSAEETVEDDAFHNPWSNEFVRMQLGQLSTHIDEDVDIFEMSAMFSVNDKLYHRDSKIGEGNFATVHLCRDMAGGQYAVKLQKKSEPWEWAILKETKKRVQNSTISGAISDAIDYCHYGNGCGVLVTSFYSSGTLLELCAYIRPFLVKRSPQMKAFTLFYSCQVINLIIELHKEDIIHGDFKPDNIMLSTIKNFDGPFDQEGKSQGVKLIDWGRAINARAISTPWVGKCYTSGFMCPQMVDDKPWRFQVDLYALAMSLHLIMFGDYAKITHKDGKAEISNMSIPRHYDRREWMSIFDRFMNHEDFTSPIAELELTRDYCRDEYEALPQREKDAFQIQFQKYLQK